MAPFVYGDLTDDLALNTGEIGLLAIFRFDFVKDFGGFDSRAGAKDILRLTECSPEREREYDER